MLGLGELKTYGDGGYDHDETPEDGDVILDDGAGEYPVAIWDERRVDGDGGVDGLNGERIVYFVIDVLTGSGVANEIRPSGIAFL